MARAWPLPLTLVLLLASCRRGPHPVAQALCRDSETFRRCYGAEEHRCLAWADEAVAKCLNDIPQPDRSRSTAHDFGLWGINIGHCSERVYHLAHADRFLASDSNCASMLSDRLARDKQEGLR